MRWFVQPRAWGSDCPASAVVAGRNWIMIRAETPPDRTTWLTVDDCPRSEVYRLLRTIARHAQS